jgi:uncharacterized protein YprB with RNaseH-like and TPR domain
MPARDEGVDVGLPPDVFKRLSRLNRELVRDQLTTGDRVRPVHVPSGAEAEAAAGAASLESLIPGRQRESLGGRFYWVRRAAEEFRPETCLDADEAIDGADLVARYRRVFFGAGVAAAPDDLPEGLRRLTEANPARVTYLDIETCGLAGEPLFLIGLMRFQKDSLRVDQLLARDYSEERPLLAAFWKELAKTECLVTFNGKTFDVPTIMSRSMACGLFEAPELPDHVDLLHESRRRWKKAVPNCRLQTLEEWICRRRRSGDIPGCDIPAAYHDFVRARQSADVVRQARSLRRLQTIMHHNALDLVTMAELVTHLLSSRP